MKYTGSAASVAQHWLWNNALFAQMSVLLRSYIREIRKRWETHRDAARLEAELRSLDLSTLEDIGCWDRAGKYLNTGHLSPTAFAIAAKVYAQRLRSTGTL